MRYFDDLSVGETIALGRTSVSEDEILAFARDFDPQPFHIDPEAAAASIYGGLIASGWHTCGLYMRLLATGFLNDTASLGSPGIDELRWPRPVRPGDELTGRLEILEVRASASRPDRGIVKSRGVMTNAAGDEVLTCVATNFVGREPEA
ncbi:MAG: MaoC family dehydratase [Actinobacteria bacterium]|nr:MaoC family dehydratase [Actinomycetota bacterium]